MAKIDVQESGNFFNVTVREGGTETTHRVSVPEKLYQELTQSKISKADCIKASFRFLLEREPKESILTRFDLPLISTYFPEFQKEFAKYVR